MARIKIKDLPKNVKISKEEMRGVAGGDDAILGRITISSFPDVCLSYVPDPPSAVQYPFTAAPDGTKATKGAATDPVDPPTLEKVPSTLKT